MLAVADSEDIQEKAMELYLRSRRRRGELLKDAPKQHGARPSDTESQNVTPPTLKEQGIDKRDVSKDQSSDW